jgi:hypothetical protein
MLSAPWQALSSGSIPPSAHLRASITTGTFCSYPPADPTSWELDQRS